MRKILFVLMMILPVCAVAQDVAASKAAVAPPKAEEKAKPVILKKDGELRELRLANLELKNLELRYKELQAAMEKMQAEIKKADDSIADFWAKLGVNRAELQTKWEASAGQNGDVILTRKVEAKPGKAPDKP